MKKIIAKSLMLICFVGALFVFNGCAYKGYKGKHPDLYTVAINSILWNNGHSYGAERAKDSQIEIIGEDEYGRILFTYYEKYYAGAKLSFSALIIMQNSDDGYAYYYEDKNYVLKEQETFSPQVEDFSKEEIEYLKSINDWGKELDLEKCVKKEISKNKQSIPCDEEIIKDKAIEEFNLSGQEYNLFLDYLTNDAEDNFIVYGCVIINNQEDIYFAALVKSTIQEIVFLVPSDLYEYQNELIIFKDNNGWVRA